MSVMNCVAAGRSVTSVVPRFSKSAHVLCVSALTSPQEVTVGVSCLWQVRQLVKDGFLVEVSEGTRKLRHVFLFTDLLLCAKMKKTAVGYESWTLTHKLTFFLILWFTHSSTLQAAVCLVPVDEMFWFTKVQPRLLLCCCRGYNAKDTVILIDSCCYPDAALFL